MKKNSLHILASLAKAAFLAAAALLTLLPRVSLNAATTSTNINAKNIDEIQNDHNSQDNDIKKEDDPGIVKDSKKSGKILYPVTPDLGLDSQRFNSSSEEESTDTSPALKKNNLVLEDSDLTFSFTITVNASQSIKTALILQPFVIEPGGKVREFGKYFDQIEEGLNTRFINIPTQIDNPLKGNYVVGYLASFKNPVDAAVTFSGEVKGALSRPVKDKGEIARKINIFVSEQSPVNGPTGSDIITVSSDLEIF